MNLRDIIEREKALLKGDPRPVDPETMQGSGFGAAVEQYGIGGNGVSPAEFQHPDVYVAPDTADRIDNMWGPSGTQHEGVRTHGGGIDMLQQLETEVEDLFHRGGGDAELPDDLAKGLPGSGPKKVPVHVSQPDDAMYDTMAVGGPGQQSTKIDGNSDRYATTIYALAANPGDVHLSRRPNVSTVAQPPGAFVMPPGASYTIRHKGEVYLAGTAGNCYVSVGTENYEADK